MQELPAVFVLRVCLIDVEALDIELLMYYSLKVRDSGNDMFRRTEMPA
jgi:neurofibromin 1